MADVETLFVACPTLDDDCPCPTDDVCPCPPGACPLSLPYASCMSSLVLSCLTRPAALDMEVA